MMPESRIIPWKRITVEAAAIVASILFAFAIDAWWERHNSRQDEQIYLTTLKAVLADNQLKVSEQIAYATALRASTRKLLDVATDPDSVLSDAELDVLLSDLTWYVGDPVTAELVSLLSDSSIARTRDAMVAYELGVLNAKLAEFRSAISLQLDLHFEELMPFLRDNVYLPQLNNVIGTQPASDDEYPVNQLRLPSYVSHQAILLDRDFHNVLIRWDWALTDIIEWRDSAVEGDTDSGIGRALEILE
jgi:hypothetical protein